MASHVFGACPRCEQDISEERRMAHIVVCESCGFVLSNTEAKIHDASDRKFLKITIGICLSLFLGFLHVSTWDSYALEVIPLKFKEFLGTSSQKDLERLAQICLDRQKLDCVEKAYGRMGEHDLSQLLRLGQFEMNRNRYDEAVNTYRTFFVKGGSDLKASYLFARALTHIGKTDEAAKYYDYVLSARPDALLQSAAVQNYARLLSEIHRPEKTRQAIESVRRRSRLAAYMMDDELRKIQSEPSIKPSRGTASVR